MDHLKNKKSPLKYFISLENRARYKLIKRYNKPLSYHDVKIINDILYNEKTHYVEQFKEYLIYEDYNEFLKCFYKSHEIKIKLPKILIFYEKYSKIYANYTVIPESKYMYKNIKRKQKMIDQMQNVDIYTEYEDDEESNEDISNTVFSSRVINSIYNKTITTLNKSDNDGNTEQSINDFLGKINLIENKINFYLKNNFINNDDKIQREKKFSKDFLLNKTKTTSKEKLINNNDAKNKIIDIQFTHSKKVLQNPNDIKKTNSNNNSRVNINNNLNNKSNYNNLIFINSYACKSKNNGNIFKNNNSIGNNTNSNNTFNNNNTFNGHKNSLKPDSSFPKKKLTTSLLKQNIINNSNNLNNYKESMSLTNVNNYFTNINNITNDQKYKLSLGETLLKLDKMILSTNSSNSPKVKSEKMFSPPNNKINYMKSKKQQIIKEKNNEKQKNKKNSKSKGVQALSSNKIINTKKIKSHLLGVNNYNSFGNNLTFLSNKFIENHKLKNISNKLNKKIANKKNINDKQNENLNNNNNSNKDNENCSNNDELSKIYKKPESHRNYCHSKILSGNNSKNKINNISNNNSNKNYKITVGLKNASKPSSKKIVSTPCSPSSSSTNFYFQSNVHSRKESINTLDKNIKKNLNENKKKKLVNNFNIVNNIHDNSTQINIYTGNNLYKSLHFQNNSVFNSSNVTPGNNSSKSPKTLGGGNIKNKKNITRGNQLSNNTTYFNSNIKEKEKKIKYNLDLKKIINKQNIESEKALISARQITNRKLFEKIGKYFFKNKNEKINVNNKNYIRNKNMNSNIKNNSKNNSKKSNNNNNIKNKNNYNDYNILINKIINKKSNSSKALKNKTNNNTPIKGKYAPYFSKNHRKVPNICLSPQDNEQFNKMNKASSRQNMNYNNIISNLNDLKNIGIDDGCKLLIHSERNKISKIVFK